MRDPKHLPVVYLDDTPLWEEFCNPERRQTIKKWLEEDVDKRINENKEDQ